MRCTCCSKLITIEACEIRGLVEDNIMANCPECGTTFVTPAPGPVSECFRMLHGVAEAVGQLVEFAEVRMALDFISDQASIPLDQQFARNLAERIDRKEKSLKDRELKRGVA